MQDEPLNEWLVNVCQIHIHYTVVGSQIRETDMEHLVQNPKPLALANGFSTWMRRSAIRLVLSTSAAGICFCLPRNGGIFTKIESLALSSWMSNSRSSMILSRFSRTSSKPDRLVIPCEKSVLHTLPTQSLSVWKVYSQRAPPNVYAALVHVAGSSIQMVFGIGIYSNQWWVLFRMGAHFKDR